MSNQLELFPKPPEFAKVIIQAKEAIKKLLELHRQPVAEELLRELEQEIRWYVRHVYSQVIAEMRDDKTIPTYLRDYLKTRLSDENILATLREGTKPTPQEKSTLDGLLRKSIVYRSAKAFKEALAFSAKFKDYAPYNNLLVRVQNPSCSYTKNGQIPEGVSLDLIAKVAGRITEMGEYLLPKRKHKSKESEAD